MPSSGNGPSALRFRHAQTLDDQHVEARHAALFVGVQEPDHAAVRRSGWMDHRAGLVVVEVVEAELNRRQA